MVYNSEGPLNITRDQKFSGLKNIESKKKSYVNYAPINNVILYKCIVKHSRTK